MSLSDPSTWLVQEVTDLVEASSVGLYEFVWMLRGRYPDAEEEQLRSWAATALQRLLQERGGRLVLLKWPSDEVVGQAARPDLSALDWSAPSDGESYLALLR